MTKGDAARERAATFHLLPTAPCGAAEPRRSCSRCELSAKRQSQAHSSTSTASTGDDPGPGTVEGEVWRCPTHTRPPRQYEGVAEGLFRRVGGAGEWAC